MTQQNPSVQISIGLPEGSVVLRAVEVVQYLGPDGTEAIACRWQGTGNILAEMGMCEYAKMEIATARWLESDDLDDEADNSG